MKKIRLGEFSPHKMKNVFMAAGTFQNDFTRYFPKYDNPHKTFSNANS